MWISELLLCIVIFVFCTRLSTGTEVEIHARLEVGNEYGDGARSGTGYEKKYRVRSGLASDYWVRTRSGADSEDRIQANGDCARAGASREDSDRARSGARSDPGSEDEVGARSRAGSENGDREWLGAGSEDRFLVVTIAQGSLRGYKDQDTGVYVFYSIPYATAPIGSQRFTAPLPEPTWQQPLDAVDKGIVCLQMANYFVTSKLMQEDCLVASVYVPDTDDKALPVVLYVHGGAFQMGFGDMIPPVSFVKNKKIIAVTFNYRLGVSGFLCLGTKAAPGNAGLKDQLALLRWVKKNIANFGGNPDDVTIVGGSAGALSVDLLMLSKTTEGLFTKVIPESGAAIGVTALQINPIEYAKNIALNLGFTEVDDIYALQKFFLDTPISTFNDQPYRAYPNSTYGFIPCVEQDTGAEVFLADAPINILREGKYKKLPMLLGFDNMEGILHTAYFDEWKEEMAKDFSNFLPVNLHFENNKEKNEVAELVKKFYFGDKPIDENAILDYVDFFTDIVFAYPTLQSAQMHVKAGHDQVYLYEYSFVDEDTPFVPHTNVRGATHCAQTVHVLDGRKYMNPNDINVSNEYNNVLTILQDIWFNFIATGNPVPEGSSLPEWLAITATRTPYMSLGFEVKLLDSLIHSRAQFWDGIFSKYYRAPVPPPAPPPRHNSEL